MAGNEVNARERLGGFSYTNAYLEGLAGAFIPKLNEPIFTSDYYFCIGDGSTSYANLKKYRWQFDSGTMSVFSDAGVLIRAETTGASSAHINLKNSVTDWYFRNNASGKMILLDNTNSKTPITVDPDCLDDMLVLNAAGKVDIGGALGFGSGGRVTVTAGTYNSLDVADTGALYFTAGTAITLNGFASGVAGQTVFFGSTMTGGAVLTLTHNSGSGTQAIRFQNGDDYVPGVYGIGMFYNPAGTTWLGGGFFGT